MNIFKLSKEHIEECADLFIEVFTKAPWNDTYDSRTQVIDFFQNHMDNDYFVGIWPGITKSYDRSKYWNEKTVDQRDGILYRSVLCKN